MNVWKAEIRLTNSTTKCLFAPSERKLRKIVSEVSALETVHSIKRVQMPERLDELCKWLNERI